MKKIFALLVATMLAGSAFGGTIRSSIIPTSDLMRHLATNETSVAFLTMLQAQLGITNIDVVVNVYGITNAFPTNTQTILLNNNILWVGTNFQAQSAALDFFAQVPTNIFVGVVQSTWTNSAVTTNYGGVATLANTSVNTATNTSGTGTITATNDQRSLVLTNYNSQFAGTFNGVLIGLLNGTNASGNFNIFNLDNRPISLPYAVVSNATMSLVSGTATNASGTGTITATNDSRSLVLTNPASQFAGTFTGVSAIGTNTAPNTLFTNTGGGGNVTVAGNFTNMGTAKIPTNTAPFNIAGANSFLVTGARNTLDANRGHHAVRVWGQYTNNVYIWLTNETTHAVSILGGLSTVNVTTNGFNLVVYGSGGDTVTLTNQFSPGATVGAAVYGSEDVTW